jgi:hypothetical protein
MGRPQVDIQVDDVTDRWSVDGLSMILVPQHREPRRGPGTTSVALSHLPSIG